jgi:uncharacterized membrane-anchored protein YhcB (DUF1043 family)
MNEVSEILSFIAIFLVGGIIGFVICRVTLGKKKEAAQQQELDQTKAELEDYKSQVNNHFNSSAELMGQVASSYQALYSHMAGQSQTLLSDMDVSPFPLLKTPDEKKWEEQTRLNKTAQETSGNTMPEDDGESVLDSNEAVLAASEAVDDSNETAIDTSEALSDTNKTELDESETVSETNETALDKSETIADSNEIALDTSETQSDSNETELDTSETLADSNETALDAGETKPDSNEVEPESSDTVSSKQTTKQQ